MEKTQVIMAQEKSVDPLEELFGELLKNPIKIYHQNNDIINGKMFYGFRVSIKERNMVVFIFEDRTVFHTTESEVIKSGIEINGKFTRFRNSLVEEENQMSNKSIVEFLKGRKTDPNELYGKIKKKLKSYLDLRKEEEYDLLVNWIIHTYLVNLFGSTSYIKVGGNQDVGKSTVMKVCSKLSFKGKLLSAPSAAVLYRTLNCSQNTLFVDEFENQNEENKEAILSVLNVGYTKEGCTIEKCDRGRDSDFEPQKFRAFSPKMFAGISDIRIPTLKSRCIELNMVRTTRKDLKNVDRIDDEEANEFQDIRDDIYIFCLENYKAIMQNFNSVDEEIYARTGQIMKPLLAIDHFFNKISPILNYYNETIKESIYEGMSRDWNYILLKTIYGVVEDRPELTIAQITEHFVSELPETQRENFNSNRIGIMLKKLGLNVNKRRTGKETMYSFTKEQIKQQLIQWQFWDMFLEQHPEFREDVKSERIVVSEEIVDGIPIEFTEQSEMRQFDRNPPT